MVITMSNLQIFINGYHDAINWTEIHSDNPELEAAYGFSSEMLDTINKECGEFFALASHLWGDNHSQAGIDFWLTRNGHGTGFWDRPEVYGEDNAKKLTSLVGYDTQFPESYIYVGDDNLIYIG